MNASRLHPHGSPVLFNSPGSPCLQHLPPGRLMFVSVAAAMVWLIGLDNIRRVLNGVVAGAGPRAQRPAAAGAGGEAAGGANPQQQQRQQPPPQAQPRGFLRSLQAVVVSFFTSLVVSSHLVVGDSSAVQYSSRVVVCIFASNVVSNLLRGLTVELDRGHCAC